MPSPCLMRTLLSLSARRLRRALATSDADALDRVHLVGELREDRRLVAAAGADLQHARAAGPPARSSSVMRATTYGCEIVWPAPIGSGLSS